MSKKVSFNGANRLNPKWIKEREGMEIGELVKVEVNWHPTFVIFPHKTISGRWYYFKKIYKRRVWRYTGFVDEPFTEYGDVFDMLKE